MLSIAATGIVFALLLSGLQEELQTAVPWVDFVVHQLMPLVLVADGVLLRVLLLGILRTAAALALVWFCRVRAPSAAAATAGGP